MNTEILYSYRDASNYKTHRYEILEGKINNEQIYAIISCLEDGELFIPSQVGLDDLQGELQHMTQKIGMTTIVGMKSAQNHSPQLIKNQLALWQ